MEGLTVEGTLQTLIVPVGAHDNKLPFKVVLETWISPELKVIVYIQNVSFHRRHEHDASDENRSLRARPGALPGAFELHD